MRFGGEYSKNKTNQFVERLFNNNEKEYFFLSKDNGSGLIDDYCAFLKLNVPFRANEHYDVFLRSKVLQLSESFQHKLGYALGNTYSRVGTQDWVPSVCDQREFEKKISKVLEGYEDVSWYDNNLYQYIKKKLKDLPEIERETINLEQIEAIVKSFQKMRDEKLDSIIQELGNVMTSLDVEESKVNKFKKRIRNNPQFTRAIK